jgi:hypothetical protein
MIGIFLRSPEFLQTCHAFAARACRQNQLKVMSMPFTDEPTTLFVSRQNDGPDIVCIVLMLVPQIWSWDLRGEGRRIGFDTGNKTAGCLITQGSKTRYGNARQHRLVDTIVETIAPGVLPKRQRW